MPLTATDRQVTQQNSTCVVQQVQAHKRAPEQHRRVNSVARPVQQPKAGAGPEGHWQCRTPALCLPSLQCQPHAPQYRGASAGTYTSQGKRGGALYTLTSKKLAAAPATALFAGPASHLSARTASCSTAMSTDIREHRHIVPGKRQDSRKL